MCIRYIEQNFAWLVSLWIRISYFLALSRVARFYATAEQKFIHSFWNALRIRRKINQLHQSSCYASSIYYTTQNNPWICPFWVSYLEINKLPCLHEIDIPKCINVYSIYRTKLCVIGFFVLSFLICFQMYETLLMARFYATTEQKLIHSFWNTLRIRRKINQLHQSSCYASSKYYTKQSLDLPI
jgi:AraC-like DNA-binding protein